MITPPTGTVTFLFTDIEGSTELAQKYPEALPALLARHHAIMRDAINAHRGFVFKIIGDAFCAAFPSAEDALNATLAAQRALQHEAWSPAPIKVRMGLNSGNSQPELDGERVVDYTGYLTLTLVQRVMSTAFGGQVLLSNSTAELLRGSLPSDVTLRDMGEHRLKGLLNLEHIWQLTAPDLIADFPALHTLNAIPNNLPTQLTSFIGREKEIAEIKHAIDSARMVTLTGVGGTGKTRLSLQAATELLESFPDGARWMELAQLSDPSLIPQSLAGMLGVRDAGNRPIMEAVIDYLRDKNLLLVLDNCEHLITACAKLAEELLKTCPQLKILASSREALGIAGEVAYHVPSLTLPANKPSPEELLKCEAARLFIERATTVQPHFAVTPQNAASIAQICQRLDGIPLALELAAARVKVFAVEQIADRLNDRFKLLTGGSRTALPRQQTLRAAIDWSHDLLPQEERALLRRLSVFIGGWSFEAAESICGDANLDSLEALSHLVDKSLVVVDQQSEAARYRLLETVRQYARDKLMESGESIEIRDRHLKFFLQFVTEAEPHFRKKEMLHWFTRFETEHENVRAAFEWALENNPETAVEIALKLPDYWARRGQVVEGADWFDEAIARLDQLPAVTGEEQHQRLGLRGRALVWCARVMQVIGDRMTQSQQKAQDALAIAQQINDEWLEAFARVVFAFGSTWLGDPNNAVIVEAEKAEAIFRKLDDQAGVALTMVARSIYAGTIKRDIATSHRYGQEVIRMMTALELPWDVVNAMSGIAYGQFFQGNYAEARPRFEAALKGFRELGDKQFANSMQSMLAEIAKQEGDYPKALAMYTEVILIWREMGHRGAVARCLESIAFIANAQNQLKRSTRLLGAANALRQISVAVMRGPEQVEYDRELAALKSKLDESTFNAEWSIGQALNMNQAVEFALGVE
jgi:predicted ATPase/class 3 adenylate cyclase